MTSTALAYARRYLTDRHWQPLPVPPGEKNPGFPGWQKLRLTEADLPGKFSNGSNVGILLGQPSDDLTDVDMDAPEARSLVREVLLRALPTDLISGRASAKESHCWYKVPIETKKFLDPLCADRKEATLVEIRSTGLHTLVAPSVHPSGERYEWSSKGQPAVVAAADLQRTVSHLAACALIGRYWTDGKRHDLSLALAGVLLRHDWSAEEVKHFIVCAARVGGDPEIEDRRQAVGTTVRRLANGEKCSGFPTLRNLLPAAIVDKVSEWLCLLPAENRSPQIEIWEAPSAFYEYDLLPFPVAALPEWLRQYVEGLACETQTPVDLSAMQVLAVCAGAIAGHIRIQARPGWVEPLNLYIVVTMNPGNRKSAVFAAACEPLEEIERELIDTMRDLIAEAASERRILEERRTRLEKEAARADDPTERRIKQNEATMVAQELAGQKVPVAPRLICADTTMEALASLLTDHDGRMCLFSPEGDLFEMVAGRYTNGAPNFDVILKGHCGDPLRVDRRGRSEHVAHPALTISLCVQPEVIQGLVDKPGFRGRGLIGRFLYSLPISTLGQREIGAKPLTPSVRESYKQSVKALGRLEPAQDANGGPAPRMLYLTADANSLLKQFEMELEPKLGDDGELGAMSDWAGKLAGAVLRISGILSLAEQVENLTPFPERVSREFMDRAISIGRYLIPHAKAAYAEMGADPQIENAKRLLRWIEKADQSSFTKREAHQNNKGRFKKVTDIEPALELLEAHGYIRARIDHADPRPGRKPSQIFDVNPILLSSSHNSHISHNSTLGRAAESSENCEMGGSGEVPGDLGSSGADVIVAEREAVQEEGCQRYKPAFTEEWRQKAWEEGGTQ
jgi:replicative DNA helicase